MIVLQAPSIPSRVHFCNFPYVLEDVANEDSPSDLAEPRSFSAQKIYTTQKQRIQDNPKI